MVFDWIVHRIRRSLEPEGVDSATLPHIGVLDIFGFESFAENGLEQLLINYGAVFTLSPLSSPLSSLWI
jgi:myosin heavy subunit